MQHLRDPGVRQKVIPRVYLIPDHDVHPYTCQEAQAKSELGQAIALMPTSSQQPARHGCFQIMHPQVTLVSFNL